MDSKWKMNDRIWLTSGQNTPLRRAFLFGHVRLKPIVNSILLCVLLSTFGCDISKRLVDRDNVNGVDEPAFPHITQSEIVFDNPPDVPKDLAIIWETWKFLNQDYVDRRNLNPENMSEEAVKGMITSLGNRDMGYVPPNIMAGSFQDVFRGDFEGIGAHVQNNAKGKLVIISPIEGGPAKAAGIRSGDIILEVDGQSLEGLTVLESVAKIRGPKGSKVKLLVQHLGAIDPVVIEIVRGRIPLTSVLLRSKPGERFAHIRITNFYPNTVEQLKQIIDDTVRNGSEGMILDLRDNPGGTLDAVVDVASQFLKEGIVLYDINGYGRKNEWKVRQGGIATDIPLVVLVNNGSASSSEVLVGALQDHQRATVIGTSTYGKGSVNILRQLSNGGGLYITISHWYTPLGRMIQEKGLKPDIEITDRIQKEADIKQLNRAIQELKALIESK